MLKTFERKCSKALDADNKLVFEYDFLESIWDHHIALATFQKNTNSFGYWIKTEPGAFLRPPCLKFYKGGFKNFKVIGNIFKNDELLKRLFS